MEFSPLFLFACGSLAVLSGIEVNVAVIFSNIYSISFPLICNVQSFTRDEESAVLCAPCGIDKYFMRITCRSVRHSQLT